MGIFVNLGLTTSYAALLSGGGGGGTGDANFGALTLAGAGGVAKPAPSTSISNDGGTNLTIVSGMVVPDTGGFGTAGTVVFNDGTEWTVTAAADTYSVLADQAEIEAAAADAPLSSTRTISVRDGTATGDRVDLTGLVFTGGLTVRSTLMGATLPGIDWSGSQKITLTGLVIYRPWSAPDAFDEVIHSNATSNCTMINCAVSSNDFSADEFYTAQPNVLAGIGAAGGSTMNNMTITDNTFTWVNRALYATGSDGVDFQRNTIQHVYGNFAELHGDNWTFKDNRGSGVWAHGGGLGQTGPNNPTGSASLYPYDWGDPHSSLFGTGSSGDNQVFMGNVLVIGPEREAIKGDYPGIGSGPKWNDPIPSATVTYSNVVCKYNVLGVSDNTGIVVGYMRDSVVSHNTIFYDTDYGTGATPNIYYSELGDNVVISHNVSCSLVYGTAGGSIFVPESTYEIGHENIIALPIGNAGTIDGDAIEYGELFAGPTFAGIAAADAIATLTPRAGRRLATGAVQIGAVGPYYNFTTGVETAPTWTKPLTATLTGVALDRVEFGSGEFFTITQSSPFLGITNADECTIMFGMQLDAASDGTDFYIVIEAGFGVSVRRLPTGRLRISWEDSAGDTSALLDTNLTFDSSDGHTVWTISARFSTYDIRVMKGTTLDPFLAVSAWSGNAMTTSRSTITVTPGADSNLSFFLLDDAFLDLHDAATMARVIARNGQHPAHGADGSTVMGSQPLIYLTGDATAWNADTLQLGSIAAPAVVTGTVADFVPDTTAPTLSSPTGAATGQTTASASVSTNEGTGTIYRVTTTSGTAPTAQQVIDGEDNSGAAAAFASSQAVSATGVQTFTEANLLVAATNYYNHYMHVDFSGNRSAVSTSAMFTTNAVTYTPTWATFPANAFLKRSTDLTGAGTTQSVLFAMTYRMGADAGADTKLLYNTPSTNKFIDVYKTSGNVIGIKQKDSSNVSRVFLYVNTALSAGVDYLILYAYDGTTDGAEMRIVRLDTGVLLPNPVKATDTLGTLTTSGQFSWNIGALADAHTQQLRGNVERVQLWTNAYSDVSLTATQRYFVEADGALVSPADSITAVGAAPIISISGADLTDGTNDGSGGAFAVQGVGTITASTSAPAAYTSGMWSAAQGSGASEIDITISTLPADGGSAITAQQYSVDGGSTWAALTGTGTGLRTIDQHSDGTTGTLTGSTSYDVRIRAVNAIGAATGSDTKATTSGAAATAPAAMTSGMWTSAQGSGASEIDITITTLPSDGGSAITALQYSVDAGATWAALTGTGTGLRTIDQHSDGSTGTLTAGTSYDVEVRAVNAVGNGADSDTKATTSGAAVAAFTPAALFAGSEVGAWYEPGDSATVFAKPSSLSVPAVTGNPIEIMLDKSDGLATGTAVVPTGWTNYGFDTFTNGGAGFTADKTILGGLDYVNSTETIAVVAGEVFEITLNIAVNPSGIGVSLGSTTNSRTTWALLTGTGVQTAYVRSNATSGNWSLRVHTPDVQAIEIISASVAKVSTRPAFQDTLAQRPVLTAGTPNYLVADGVDDNLNWTAPTDTYTVATINSAGAVSIATSQALSGVTDVFAGGDDVAGYVAVNRALTGGETTDLTTYMETTLAAPAFTPAALFAASQVGVWYDPSDLGAMWQDEAGTVAVTTTGQTVARIDDKSGNGFHATQSSAGLRPLLQQDGSGKYYLEFDGVDDFMQSSNVSGLFGEFWACCGVQFPALDGAAGAGVTFGALLNSSNMMTASVRASGGSINFAYIYSRIAGGTQTAPVITAFATLDPYLINFGREGSDIAVSVNSGAYSTGTLDTGDLGLTFTGPIRIGQPTATGNRFYGGVYRLGTMSAGDKTDLQNFIADKTGVTL